MARKQAYRTSCAAAAVVALLQNAALAAETSIGPAIVAAGAVGTDGAEQYRDIDATSGLWTSRKIELLRRKVKYVFVIFQENRAFDHYFGTYPGADGLFDRRGKLIASNLGSTQAIRDIDGTYATISPFLIPTTVRDTNGKTVQIYPEDTASVDHSHTGIDNGAHFVETKNPTTVQNNGYALDQEGLRFSGASSDTSTVVSTSNNQPPTANPTLAKKQMGELALGHLDCDTIPFLWRYADRFTLFDNFHQTTIGPSTPNAIAMIAGQSGETQWALHPAQGTEGIVPVVSDPGPFPGSNLDTSKVKASWGPDENPNQPNGYQDPPQNSNSQAYGNLTSATLPLSFMGSKINEIIKQDQDPTADLLDVQQDITEIASSNPHVRWGWYQQGFGPEPFDTPSTTLNGGVGSESGSCGNPTTPGWITGCNWPLHGSYIVHHNGPQYFGYLGDNKAELKNMHSLQQFYTDVAKNSLPEEGGVFYVRGGYGNNDELTPVVPNVTEQGLFVGNDDHPAYSDAMISEASVADTVNAIAKSSYWDESAIIITYDETDGLYDHAPFHVRSWDQNGLALAGGPRIPAIVISPYSAAHTISNVYSEHSSVIKFIDELFGLAPLADLPDERNARKLGESELGQSNLGPADALVQPMGDLTEAFDIQRLLGNAPKLPSSYAIIDPATVHMLPAYHREGCRELRITPTDYPRGLSGEPSDPAPADFNPRPSTAPGIPTSGTWTP